MITSIANYGRSLRPWYNNALIPQGAVFGTVYSRYEYTTDENTGRTIKRLVSCDKIPFYCTDFRPQWRQNKYTGANIPVYNIVVFDVERKRFIRTTTSSSSKYFYIGEILDEELVIYKLDDTHVLPCAYHAKNVPCQLRTVGEYKYNKGVYGYMCKTPDRTITEMPVIGDDYAENRRFKR